MTGGFTACNYILSELTNIFDFKIIIITIHDVLIIIFIFKIIYKIYPCYSLDLSIG